MVDPRAFQNLSRDIHLESHPDQKTCTCNPEISPLRKEEIMGCVGRWSYPLQQPLPHTRGTLTLLMVVLVLITVHQ